MEDREGIGKVEIAHGQEIASPDNKRHFIISGDS